MLSIRLKSILDFIEPSDYVADVGTDHGYLLISCLEKGVSLVQGIENKEGPYLRAEKNLSPYIQDKRAILSLSNGINELHPSMDTIVIAGMGGELIVEILDECLCVAKKMKKIILEPNIREYELRKYLSTHSFTFLDEKIVSDKGKYYEIMIVKYNESTPELTEKECYFGPILLQQKTEIFVKKWKEKMQHIQKICEENDTKIRELEKQKERIMEVFNDESK